MWQAGDAPTLVSRKYMLFGKVSVTVKAAKGRGIVTAITLKSDSGDEIDWVSDPLFDPIFEPLSDPLFEPPFQNPFRNALFRRQQ